MNLNEILKSAITHALAGEWDTSHKIVQQHNDPMANWIHAVLHKIEGDLSNSRYWYAHTGGRSYEDFPNPQEELKEIMQGLETT